MVVWGEVKRWAPGPLLGAVGPMNDAYNKIVALSDDLRDINTPDGWRGDAASAAAGQVDQIIDGLEEYAAEIAAGRRSVGDTGDAISGVVHGVVEVEGLATSHHFTIADSGAIVDNGPPPDTPDDQKQAVARDRQKIAAELRDRIDQVIRSATDVDDDFCVVLDRILSGHTIDAAANDNEHTSLAAAANAGDAVGSLTIPAPPPEGATVAQNAAYWATLSEGQRTRLAMDRPELVGPRDGFSAVQRDIANRTLMERARTRLQHERDLLQKKIDDFPRLPSGELKLNDRLAFDRLKADLETLDKKLRGIDSVSQRLEPEIPGRPPAYLLGINGDNVGQAIVAIGNPDTAANVATYVPGTFAGLDGMATDINRSDLMVRAAEDAGSRSTSVITWAGYDAPQSLPAAGSTDYADGGAPRLDRFQDGLAASHDPKNPMNSTVIGHSYGTTVVGHAARDLGLNTGNVVFVASPGVGVDQASQLHLDGVSQNQVPSHVHSTIALTDPIGHLTNIHNPMADSVDPLGPDPADRRFGGDVFESNMTNPATSHSDYWNRGSTSLRGMGEVIAGRAPT
ncbi:alpha/beta hydrolase [Amycolatopsis sp. cg5]|uniref:alpha/beta hydrolase n=1 Tax=Amycolatopsis sp. cg5 TaxID=3238802 RepID=UPI0035233D2B